MPCPYRVPRSAADRGAGYPEYALTILLVAAVLAGLIGSGVSARVSDGIADAVCAVGAAGRDEPDCTEGGDATGGGGRPLAAGDPTGAGWLVPLEDLPAAPPPPERRGALGQWEPDADEEWLTFQDRGAYTWDCGAAADLACKIGGGFAQGGRDLWDGAAAGLCLLHVCSRAGFREGWWSVGQAAREDPLTTAGRVWDGFTDPLRENWRAGGPVKAIAYALPAALGGALRAFTLVGRGLPDPPTADDVRADLADARAASERGDIGAADEAIAAAEEKLDALGACAEHAGCPVAAPARPGGPGAPMTAAPVAAGPLPLFAPGGDGAADRSPADRGPGSAGHLAEMVAAERERRDFFTTRAGRRAAASVDGLLRAADDAEDAGGRGRVGTAERSADRARTLAEDLRDQADEETDPDRRRFLEDAADTGDRTLVRARDGARTARAVELVTAVPGGALGGGDGPAPDHPSLHDLWRRVHPVVDYTGTGAPFIDHGTVGADGRPVLRVDRSRYGDDTELAAAVAQALVLDGHGYYELGPDGLRAVTRDGDHGDADGDAYVAASLAAHTEANLAAVRVMLLGRPDGAEEPDIADPVLRQAYADALRDLRLEDGTAQDGRSGGAGADDRAPAARGPALRATVQEALAGPVAGLGGRSAADVVTEEYASASPPGAAGR
jgi:hypothetical protein